MNELRKWLDEQIAAADGRGARNYAERSEVLREVRERLTGAPALEVVSGAEAAALPVGSRVCEANDHDVPAKGSVVVEPTSELVPDGRFVVLHRGLPPAPPLAVGDVVETAADLDRLPVTAIVEDRCRNVASRLEPDVSHEDACWGITGLDGPAHGYELYFPAVVRYLPGAAS